MSADKRRKIVYWCVPHRESGYNKRFRTRKEAFAFWRDNKEFHSKPGKVEIRYWTLLELVDNCLAGESTVQEPYHDNPIEREGEGE